MRAVACAVMAVVVTAGEIAAQEEAELAWRNPDRAREWAADSTRCDRRARAVAGQETGATVRAEFAACLDNLDWRLLRRFAAEPNCRAWELQWLDVTSADSVHVPRLSSVVRLRLDHFEPVAHDRSESRRIAIQVMDGVMDGRIVGAQPTDLLGTRILLALNQASVGAPELRRARGVFDGVLVFRGACLQDVRISASEYASLTETADPNRVYFEFEVGKHVTQMPGNPPVRYPDALRTANIEGEVLVHFVVDTSGVPEMSTFKVLKSTHDLFSASVREAIAASRYHPAEIGERKVRQIVQQEFNFTLTR